MRWLAIIIGLVTLTAAIGRPRDHSFVPLHQSNAADRCSLTVRFDPAHEPLRSPIVPTSADCGCCQPRAGAFQAVGRGRSGFSSARRSHIFPLEKGPNQPRTVRLGPQSNRVFYPRRDAPRGSKETIADRLNGSWQENLLGSARFASKNATTDVQLA